MKIETVWNFSSSISVIWDKNVSAKERSHHEEANHLIGSHFGVGNHLNRHLNRNGGQSNFHHDSRNNRRRKQPDPDDRLNLRTRPSEDAPTLGEIL